MASSHLRFRYAVACFALGLFALPIPLMGQGVVLHGVGPINRSMGGAATAAPLDAIGAIHWNPATISALPASEMSFGLEAVLPASDCSSQVAAGAFGPGVPPVDLAGSTGAELGVSAIPSFAFVHKPEDSCWTYGLGVFGIGGFGGNYAASLTNPILTPPPPNGFGVGRVAAQLDVLQLAPTISRVLTDRISIGFAPTITLARLTADPGFFTTPDDANGDGFPTYPAATGTRATWGGGFQAGIYYTTDVGWHLGASVKSPQWFEPFRFNVTDELGRPSVAKFGVDYPLIGSFGVAYSGYENYLIACDVRYYDYANTRGFRSADFDPTGALTGLGWNSVLGVSTGIERRVNDCLSLRLGYAFNENPIPGANTAVNVASPLVIQHWLTMGLSYRMAQHWIFSLAYVHGFENSIEGPITTALGPAANTSVTSTGSLDSLSAGITVRF